MEEDMQTEDETIWAVISAESEVVKGGFKTEDDARAWMDTDNGKKLLAKIGSNGYDVESQAGFGTSSDEAEDEDSDDDDDEEE
jgi:hypothetical protein